MDARRTDRLRKNAGLLGLTIAAVSMMTCATAPRLRTRAAAPGREGIVSARDGHLWLDGRRYRFIGVNVYSLASAPPGSGGFACGNALGDDGVRQIIREVAAMGGNAIRIDAYQSFTAGGTDFSRLDLILREARENGVRVILTLENQWPDCTEGGYKYADWYRSGYREPYGAYPLSYREYVARVAERYRGEPAVLMWQLMNEAESRTVQGFDDPEALMAFTADMASVVRNADPDHIVSLGTIGVARQGSGGAFYALLHQIDGIGIAEAHDYHAETDEMPREVWLSLLAARAVGRPFFIGEVGMDAPPLTPSDRAGLIAAKLEAAWHEDVDGVLIWSYRAGDGGDKDFDIRDPLAGVIRRFSATRHVRDRSPAPALP
ncbi:MAG: hypothetical protein RL272_1259 [Candidatus Parcubacteria bacterium]|jgi:hypothetical protein